MITNTVFVFDCVPFVMLAGFCIHFFPNQSLLYLLWSALTWQLCSCIKGWPNYSLFMLVSRVRTPFTRVLWQRWSTLNMRASNGQICPSPSNTVCRTIQEERKSWSSLLFFFLFVFKSPFGCAFATVQYNPLTCVSMHCFGTVQYV